MESKVKPTTCPRSLPKFGLSFYARNAKGEYAGVTMYATDDSKYAVCTENGPESVPLEPLLDGMATRDDQGAAPSSSGNPGLLDFGLEPHSVEVIRPVHHLIVHDLLARQRGTGG